MLCGIVSLLINHKLNTEVSVGLCVCLYLWCFASRCFQGFVLYQKGSNFFATNSNFLIHLSFQMVLYYCKLRHFDLTEFIVWYQIYQSTLRYWVAKVSGLEKQSLWKRLNSFTGTICSLLLLFTVLFLFLYFSVRFSGIFGGFLKFKKIEILIILNSTLMIPRKE